MKTKEELEKYRETIIGRYGKCSILTANQDINLKNCNGTSNREAENRASWIDYWRAMTGCYLSILYCSSCGKLIFVNQVPKIMEPMFKEIGEKSENHLAVGGHVWVKKNKNDMYPEGKYIVPLCPLCNNNGEESISIRKETKLCKELCSHINQEN